MSRLEIHNLINRRPLILLTEDSDGAINGRRWPQIGKHISRFRVIGKIRSKGAAYVKTREISREILDTTIGQVPLVTLELGKPIGLPEPAPGVLNVVSPVVALESPGRDDLLVIHEKVLNERGKSRGVLSLGFFRMPGIKRST